jgi:hypothetical protein
MNNMWIQLQSSIENTMESIDDMVNEGYALVADVIDNQLDGWVLTYGVPTPGISDLYGAHGCGYFDAAQFSNVHGNFQAVLDMFRSEGIDDASEVFRILRHDWQFCIDRQLIVNLHGYENLPN